MLFIILNIIMSCECELLESGNIKATEPCHHHQHNHSSGTKQWKVKMCTWVCRHHNVIYRFALYEESQRKKEKWNIFIPSGCGKKRERENAQSVALTGRRRRRVKNQFQFFFLFFRFVRFKCAYRMALNLNARRLFFSPEERGAEGFRARGRSCYRYRWGTFHASIEFPYSIRIWSTSPADVYARHIILSNLSFVVVPQFVVARARIKCSFRRVQRHIYVAKRWENGDRLKMKWKSE